MVCAVVLGVTFFQFLEDRSTPSDSPSSLQVHFAVATTDSHRISAVKQNGILQSGDHYGIYFEPNQDAFVYVLQQDASGAIDFLFPNPKWSSRTNPIPQGEGVWIPGDIGDWFYLDKTVGREVIWLVATSQPNTKLISEKNSEMFAESLKKLRLAEGVHHLDPKPILLLIGENTKLGTLLLGGDMEFVYKFEFEHR